MCIFKNREWRLSLLMRVAALFITINFVSNIALAQSAGPTSATTTTTTAKSACGKDSNSWFQGDNSELNRKILLTFNNYEWSGEAEPYSACAGEMRKKIIRFMLDKAWGNTESVAYFVHYLNLDHTSDSVNYSSDKPGYGFIPKEYVKDVLAFIEKHAPNLSRQELAKVLSYDSLEHQQKLKPFYLPPKIKARVDADNDPDLLLDVLAELSKSLPINADHPAFDLFTEGRIAAMSDQQLAKATVGSDYKVYQEADREGTNRDKVNEIRFRMLAEMSKRIASSGRGELITRAMLDKFLPNLNSDESALSDDLQTALSNYIANVPVSKAMKFYLDKVKGREAAEISRTTLLNRSAEDLLVLLSSPLIKDTVFRADLLKALSAKTDRSQDAGRKLWFEGIKQYFAHIPNNEGIKDSEIIEDLAATASTFVGSEELKKLLAEIQHPQFAAIIVSGVKTRAHVVPNGMEFLKDALGKLGKLENLAGLPSEIYSAVIEALLSTNSPEATQNIRELLAREGKESRAKALPLVIKIYQNDIKSLDPELAKIFASVLRFDFSANKSKEKLEASLKLVKALCLEPEPKPEFKQIQLLCGFPQADADQATLPVALRQNALQSLAELYRSLPENHELSEQVEELIGRLEARHKEIALKIAKAKPAASTPSTSPRETAAVANAVNILVCQLNSNPQELISVAKPLDSAEARDNACSEAGKGKAIGSIGSNDELNKFLADLLRAQRNSNTSPDLGRVEAAP